jgi:hypothetical protein
MLHAVFPLIAVETALNTSFSLSHRRAACFGIIENSISHILQSELKFTSLTLGLDNKYFSNSFDILVRSL